jgi:hypothetical protein
MKAAVDELDKMANDPERAKFWQTRTIDQVVQRRPAKLSIRRRRPTAITTLKDEIVPAGGGLRRRQPEARRPEGEGGRVQGQARRTAASITRTHWHSKPLQSASVSEPQYTKLQPMRRTRHRAGQLEPVVQAEDCAQAPDLVQTHQAPRHRRRQGRDRQAEADRDVWRKSSRG